MSKPWLALGASLSRRRGCGACVTRESRSVHAHGGRLLFLSGILASVAAHEPVERPRGLARRPLKHRRPAVREDDLESEIANRTVRASLRRASSVRLSSFLAQQIQAEDAANGLSSFESQSQEAVMRTPARERRSCEAGKVQAAAHAQRNDKAGLVGRAGSIFSMLSVCVVQAAAQARPSGSGASPREGGARPSANSSGPANARAQQLQTLGLECTPASICRSAQKADSGRQHRSKGRARASGRRGARYEADARCDRLSAERTEQEETRSSCARPETGQACV